MFETLFGYLLVNSSSMQPGHFDGLKTKIEALDVVFAKIKRKADSINKSGLLTPPGKKEERAKLALQAVEMIDAVGEAEKFDTLKAHAAEIEVSIRNNAAPKEESLRDYLRAQEIRSHYKSLDPIGQQAFFDDALREVRAETVEALRDSPYALPGLSKQLNQGALAEYDKNDLSRIDPEKAAERDSLLEAHGEVQTAIKTMAKALRDDGIAVPIMDDVRAIAESSDSDDEETDEIRELAAKEKKNNEIDDKFRKAIKRIPLTSDDNSDASQAA